MSFEKKIEDFLQQREQGFQKLNIPEPEFSSELREEILNAPVTHIKQLLEQKQVTSEQLLNLYARRAYSIGKKLCYITVQNYEQALLDARRCDKLRQENPEECKGELFGVVMSVKECFDMKGLPSTVGIASRLDYIPEQDGLAINVLKSAGAVIFVKTNVPQLCLLLETVNNVFGRGLNCWDQTRNIGGSSGGEAALIASRCSPLGLGSDIGGSIRNPSSQNGITGLKPTADRISTKGHTYFEPQFNGQQNIKNAIGPMGKYVDDIVLCFKALINDEYHKTLPFSQQDLYHNNKPFNQQQFETDRKLKIAYFKSLPIFTPPLSVQRAVQESVDALQKRGHEVVEIKYPFWERTRQLFFEVFAADRYSGLQKIMEGEKMVDGLEGFVSLMNMKSEDRDGLIKQLESIGETRGAQSISFLQTCDAAAYKAKTGEILQLRDQYVKYMEENNFDAIICPANGTPPGTHDYTAKLVELFNFTGGFNTLNVPSGVLPITVVREDEQTYDLDDGFNDSQTGVIKEVVKGSKGLPLCAQIVGIPMQEEMVFNIMKQVEQEVQFHKNHPYPDVQI